MKLTNYIRIILLFMLLSCLGSSAKNIASKGVLDRLEGDQAIILLESINKTIVVPESSLPIDSEVHMWFNVECINGTYQVVSIDANLTKENEQKSTHLLHKLRKIKGELE